LEKNLGEDEEEDDDYIDEEEMLDVRWFQRNEVLSGRWRGFAPSSPHNIIIEYIEER